MELEKTHFEYIQEDNSKEEQEKQRNRTKSVFDKFKNYSEFYFITLKSENYFKERFSNKL